MPALQTATASTSLLFLAALFASGSVFGQAASSVAPGATASAVSPGSTAASSVAPGTPARPIRPAVQARSPAPVRATAGSLGGATPASDSADCAARRKAYLASQACFAPYRLANGGIRAEANGKCRAVVDPSPQCGQNFPAK